MRRQLVLLILATTVLVVVALIVPLGLLVRDQATDSAKVAAEADAQQVAGVVALAVAVSNDQEMIAEAVGDLPEGTIVVLADGEIVGEAASGQGQLAASAISSGSTIADAVPGGWEVAIPVLGADATVAVDSFVTDDQLTDGVWSAWGLLAVLGLLLVFVAVIVADRMATGLVQPIEALADSAHKLGDGQIDTRVQPSEPSEIREMGEAFNYLAGRLQDLLIEERESVADLSHRLRTPLTALRLQAETLADADEREAMLSQIDRLERSMDDVINLTRANPVPLSGSTELDELVESRLAYWKVLADEQDRQVELTLGSRGETVSLPPGDVVAIVDILIENVFSYTPVGSPITVTTGSDGGAPWLQVADRGSGFAEAASERGVSGAGSTGLGLDIVRKSAGTLKVDDRPGGGAVVKVVFDKT